MVFVVIGCYGFIGLKMCRFLLEQKHKVYGIDVNDKKQIFDENFEFIHFDLVEMLKKVKNTKIDVVYHLAWNGVSTTDKNDLEKQITNLSITLTVLQFVKTIGVKKLVIPGSVSEFSKCKKGVTGKEKDSPADYYAATKVCVRKIAQQFCKRNDISLNWALVTSVYGGERVDNNLLTYTIKNLLMNEQVLTTKLEQKWDYIYIDDLIFALYLIGIKGRKNIIYPIGSGRVEKLSFYVEYIASFLEKSNLLKLGALDYKNNYIDNSIVDITKLNNLGFTCKKEFEENIEDVISFYKSEIEE